MIGLNQIAGTGPELTMMAILQSIMGKLERQLCIDGRKYRVGALLRPRSERGSLREVELQAYLSTKTTLAPLETFDAFRFARPSLC